MIIDLPMPQANKVDRAIYPDHYIEFYADRWILQGKALKGVTLMQFLARPNRYDNLDTSLDPLPLLPVQEKIRKKTLMNEFKAARAEREAAKLPYRNGSPFEKMAHHRHPTTDSAFQPRSAKA